MVGEYARCPSMHIWSMAGTWVEPFNFSELLSTIMLFSSYYVQKWEKKTFQWNIIWNHTELQRMSFSERLFLNIWIQMFIPLLHHLMIPQGGRRRQHVQTSACLVGQRHSSVLLSSIGPGWSHSWRILPFLLAFSTKCTFPFYFFIQEYTFKNIAFTACVQGQIHPVLCAHKSLWTDSLITY